MPQRKKTQPLAHVDPTDLEDLTDKQVKFVTLILEGTGPSDAYRQSHDVTTATPKTIATEAWRLRQNPDIARVIQQARIGGFGAASVTKEGHLTDLLSLREEARATGNIGAAVQAEQFRGKVAGLYVERYEDVTPPDPAETLKSIATFAPDLARQLAERAGVDLVMPHTRVIEHEPPEQVSGQTAGEG